MNCDLKIPFRMVCCERIMVPDRPNLSTAAGYPKQVHKESGENSGFGFA